MPSASLYWFRVYGQFSLSEKWILNGEVDERRFFNPDRQSTFFGHTHLHRSLGHHWDTALGFSYNRSQVSSQLGINEYRPFAEVTKTWLPGRSNISFRYRLDNRFIQKLQQQVRVDGYDFSQRHRFRTQWIQPLTPSSFSHPWFLKVANETMLNSDRQLRTVDQVRNYVGAEHTLDPHWSIETGYLHIYLTHGLADSQIRNVWRTTVYYRIGSN